jgi:hypothetical protein
VAVPKKSAARQGRVIVFIDESGLSERPYASRRLLFKWLNRRSQRRSVKWDHLDGVLPRPRIIHSLYPNLLRKPSTGSRMV